MLQCGHIQISTSLDNYMDLCKKQYEEGYDPLGAVAMDGILMGGSFDGLSEMLSGLLKYTSDTNLKNYIKNKIACIKQIGGGN